VIHDPTELIFFGLVGVPIMLAFALMPWSYIERFHAKRGFALPSRRTVLVTRTMAATIACYTVVDALRYLAGL
jgi:hypothetical protein